MPYLEINSFLWAVADSLSMPLSSLSSESLSNTKSPTLLRPLPIPVVTVFVRSSSPVNGLRLNPSFFAVTPFLLSSWLRLTLCSSSS